MEMPIQRYDCYGAGASMDRCDYGSWVSYAAHKEAIDSLRAEVEALRGDLEQIGAIGNDAGGGDWDEIEEARGIAFRALDRKRPE